MVELYCELLLARANVLDQVAFGEKGAAARSRVREEKMRSEAKKKPGSAPSTGGNGAASGESGGSRSLFGFSFGKASRTTPTPDTTKSEDPNISTKDNDDEEINYIDPALDEAALVVFYAWPRFPHDVRELTIVRTFLADRFGKDYMALAQENKLERVHVPERLVKGLRVRPPAQDLVDNYLREIARAYGIAWGEQEQEQQEAEADLGRAPPEFIDGENKDDAGNDNDNDAPDLPSTPQKQQQHPDLSRRTSETSELSKATPPRGAPQPGKSPVSVAPPAPRTDNPNPRVKVPGQAPSSPSQTDAQDSSKAPAEGGKGDSGSGGKDPNRIPEVDELSRRFAALRR